MEKKQNTPALESCQLKLDAKAVAGVDIKYTMCSQVKDEDTHKFKYIISKDNVTCNEYILECNEPALVYLKNLYSESPNAVYLRRAFVDTMPDIINHDKYRQIFLTLMDDQGHLHYNRYIILVNIKRELLDDSKPFSRDFKRYRNFDEFLKVNGWIRSRNDDRVATMEWTVRDTAMYFIDALESSKMEYLIPKILDLLNNISKQAKLNHKIRL